MRRTLIVCAFLAVLLTTVSSSVVGGTMSSSKMKGSDASDWLIGTWACTAHMMAMPKSPAHTETDTMTFQRAVNGMWIDQTYTGKSFMGRSFWRWDKPTKQLVSIGVDSFGGYGVETSPGMQGSSTMTMSGSMTYAGHPSKVVDIVTKISNTKLRHIGKYTDASGKWVQSDDTTCTKNS